MTDLRKAAEMACEVPLHELLEGVPENARLVIDSEDGMNTNYIPVGQYCRRAASALRQALAQEQEPVAHLWECIGRWTAMIAHDGEDANLAPPDWLVDAVKAATAPPKHEWVGLTAYDKAVLIDQMWNQAKSFEQFIDSIDKFLKEKNT